MDSTFIGPVSKKRLIVLVPEGFWNSPDFAKKIYWLATRDQRDVHYLVFVSDQDDRLVIARSTATLKALTAHDAVAVTSKLIHPDNCLAYLGEIVRPGDRIVCHEEQLFRTGFMATTPIRDLLSKTFNVPVEALSGFYHPWRALSRKWLLGLLFWVGCLVILALFSLLEISIDRTEQGVTQTILIFLVLIAEFGAFWAWNHLPRS
jgi:hypothetical protein